MLQSFVLESAQAIGGGVDGDTMVFVAQGNEEIDFAMARGRVDVVVRRGNVAERGGEGDFAGVAGFFLRVAVGG